MNKPLSLLVTLIIIGVLFFSAYIIKNQSDKNALIIDNTAKNLETTLNTEQMLPNKTDTVLSLAAVTQTDTQVVAQQASNSRQVPKPHDTTFVANTTNNTKKATETAAKPSIGKLGNVVALTPKQLAEQKLARQTATAQTSAATTNTPKPQSVKTATTSNNKQVVTSATAIRYSVTIGCFADTKHHAHLRTIFKLKSTENIRVAKHQTNNCWRYMVGNYLSSAEAFKKLAELRKYDKDCQVVRIGTKNNKETIEIYKE